MYNDVMKFSSAKPGNHNELNDFLQGKGQYTSDIDLPGQLHASFVRSPYASALIKKNRYASRNSYSRRFSYSDRRGSCKSRRGTNLGFGDDSF